jgi:hypothetical protein
LDDESSATDRLFCHSKERQRRGICSFPRDQKKLALLPSEEKKQLANLNRNAASQGPRFCWRHFSDFDRGFPRQQLYKGIKDLFMTKPKVKIKDQALQAARRMGRDALHGRGRRKQTRGNQAAWGLGTLRLRGGTPR